MQIGTQIVAIPIEGNVIIIGKVIDMPLYPPNYIVEVENAVTMDGKTYIPKRAIVDVDCIISTINDRPAAESLVITKALKMLERMNYNNNLSQATYRKQVELTINKIKAIIANNGEDPEKFLPMNITPTNNLDATWNKLYAAIAELQQFKSNNFAISVNGESVMEKTNELDRTIRFVADACHKIEPFLTKEKRQTAPHVIL